MMPSPDRVLRIRGLTISLPAGADRPHAVEGIDLDVERREIVCVVGESGSGKSVTAHAIMGLLPVGRLRPVAGEISLVGEEILQATPRRLRELRATRMGMIFQEPMTALNPTMTVGNQIDEVLRAHTSISATERTARVLELMERVRLPEPQRLMHVYPHQLSGGQRQRIVIAIALALEPALIIADEPTTALDVTTQSEILKLLRELQSRMGMGVLFITHDFGVVAEIADRVVVMRKGQVVETGTRDEILSRPRHPYTQALIAAVPSGLAMPLSTSVRPQPVLRVSGLSKTYVSRSFFRGPRVVTAASDVSFQLWHGEVLGIVGESGSGKSTVARCIARMIEPSAGQVELAGTRIDNLSVRALLPHRRHVQIIFQDPYRSLNPRRTVLESLIEGPRNFGVPRPQAIREIEELVSLVGLAPAMLDRYPHQFSGGQRQRLCIARALALKPKLLIADEAVSALDVSVQAQVLDLLETVRRRFELAILFITHDLRVAMKICNRVLVMNRGRVVEQGTTAEVFLKPQNEYTRLLFASTPGRNLFHRSGGEAVLPAAAS